MTKKFKFKTKKEKEKWLLSTNLESSDIIGDDFRIEMSSNKEITVEGKVSVYEYRNDYIKLHIKKGYLTVSGNNFDIINYAENSISFNGNITSIEFEL